MKKLMLIAAVAFCGAAFAEGEITSNNIVGYMNNGNTVAGLNVLSGGFQDIGVDTLNLTSIKVTNVDGGEVTTGSCNIQIIDGLGKAVQTYTWVSKGRGDTKRWCWQDSNKVEITDSVKFARGAGILFTAESIGDRLDTAGEVNLKGITVGDLKAGLNVVANPYPVELMIKELVVKNAASGDVTTGSCNIQIIDGLGKAAQTYTWVSKGRDSNKRWCWQDSDKAEVTDVDVIGAGEGILFTAENAGDKLIFPAK